MSQTRKDGHVEECYRITDKVVRESSNKALADIPPVFLQLKPILISQTLSVKQASKVKEYIWLNDLLHVNVETLRQDFTKVKGQWATAAELASTLSSICSGLHPKENRRAGQSSYTEQVREFYDILLPTCADSLLILANNLLEKEQQCVDSGLETSNVVHFQSILDSLLEVCRSHKQCVERVLQSPYLLHLLISDLVDHCAVLLSFLSDLVVIDYSFFSSLPQDILFSVLDELVFKLSGEQERGAVLSLELMATFAMINHSLVELIFSRYSGVLDLAMKWSKQKRSSVNVTNFISQLKTHVDNESHDNVHRQAAAVIQAAWRGYSTRRKLKKMQRGVAKFQQIFRERKAKKLQQAKEHRMLKTLRTTKELSMKSKRLTFQEKQLSVMEQLPASEIDKFVFQQETTAATVIQSWWRSKLARVRYNNLCDEKKRSQSAAVIQRTFRKYRKRNSEKNQPSLEHHQLLRQIEGAEREALQGEIAQYQEHHPPSYLSESQARDLHERVQNLTEQFYLSRVEQHRKDRQRVELLSQLNNCCEMLLRAPNLSDSYTMPDVSKSFTASHGSSNSGHGVSTMARTAHREELRALNTPWWKRQTLDTVDALALL